VSGGVAAYEILNKIEITLIVWAPSLENNNNKRQQQLPKQVLATHTHIYTHSHTLQKAKTISEFDAQIHVGNVTANAVTSVQKGVNRGEIGRVEGVCLCVCVCVCCELGMLATLQRGS